MPVSSWAITAIFFASAAKGTPTARPLSVASLPKMMRSDGRHGATVMAPSGASSSAQVSSQPAMRVSAKGTSTANRPATPSRAKPSVRLAPAPPSFSGTQARGRPASASARQNGALQVLSSTRLMVCGSARSAKIRAAKSATIWSLSPVTTLLFSFPGRQPSRPLQRAMVSPSSTNGKLSHLWAFG